MLFGWTWIPHNECVLVVSDRDGSMHTEMGPRYVYLFRESCELMTRTHASVDQYLVVEHLDGSREHLAGPCVHYFNSLIHRSVTAKRKLVLSSGYASVLFRKDPGTADVSRHILTGPIQYTPEVGEWSHQFSWLIPDPTSDNPTSRDVKIQFYKLRVVPDQMMFTVKGVRTKDDALLDIKFMVFYHLIDIPRMLDTTHDPAGDLCSTITADAMEFTSLRTFESFKAECEQLNQLATFSQLIQRLEATGYKALKVAYLGYEAGSRLQDMHNGSIEKRTGLQLHAENQMQEQDLKDTELQRQLNRERQELEMARERQAYDNETKQLDSNAQLLRSQALFESEFQQKLKTAEQAAEEQRRLMEIELERDRRLRENEVQAHRDKLAGLAEIQKSTGLDITAYLCALAKPLADQRIEVSGVESGKMPALHVHSQLKPKL